jgi:HSP20 family protein
MPQNPFSDLFNLDPLAELTTFREAFRQMVEAGWPMPRDFMPAGMAAVVIPVDVLDTGPEIVVQTNLPGVKPADLNISVTGTTLTIKGVVQEPSGLEGATYLRRERRAAGFYRTVQLPVEVDAESADAKFENGVLTLTLPKSEKVRPRTIRITKE